MSYSRVAGVAVIVAVLVTLAPLTAAPAGAQLTEIHLFTCKVVCGYQLGNVRLLNDTSPLNQPYENLKPGNYATICNLYNYDLSQPDQTILPYLAIRGAPLFFLGAFTIPSLDAGAFGCIDIVNAINPPPTGFAFEGYLTLYTFTDQMRVDGVHTKSSQNAFERHVVWGFEGFGILSIAFQTIGLDLTSITNPLSVAGVFVEEAFAASGAGGLGLGTSIDIENYERITISLTPETEPNLPPEVLDMATEMGLTQKPDSGG